MKHLVLALFAALFWTSAAPAQEAVARDPAIETTIQSQLDAFLRDDFVTAFSFAAPSIKGMFGTPEVFGQMVRQGYPMVWRPGDVRFTELYAEGGEMAQRVLIQDQDGRTHLLEYRRGAKA